MSKTHEIRITMEGGVIQAVDNVPEGVRVVVMDFDVEGYDESELKTNDRGERYHEIVYDGCELPKPKRRGKPDPHCLTIRVPVEVAFSTDSTELVGRDGEKKPTKQNLLRYLKDAFVLEIDTEERLSDALDVSRLLKREPSWSRSDKGNLTCRPSTVL